MKTVLAAAAVFCTVLLPCTVSADTGLKNLFKREQSALGAMPDQHLKSLLTAAHPKRSKGKTPDFSFSKAWLDAQPEAEGGDNWRCLSEALYFEARGETVKGQFAVAEVIMNRVRSARYPDTLCGVIRQGTGKRYQCQFTYTCDGRAEVIREPQAFERVSKVARAIMDGFAGNLTDGATHYHTLAVKPRWANVYTRTAKIGDHLFYRHNYRTASSN
ncbi:cell wall hydrolase [Pseudodonghicola flavimaris]|uniref:Cell wall hydrolase n=1 Tax=Pseudodonghicola flavimaris TaxID=3050036 RepID=A0ABT7F023_9RHOB|nr:cell wall hydrolase [Pseudodonghicola flavimaris]MDK3017951.1 cell wall hydrolase [Pseudodonghicola flavimaris]